jgi:hypothetical protein
VVTHRFFSIPTLVLICGCQAGHGISGISGTFTEIAIRLRTRRRYLPLASGIGCKLAVIYATSTVNKILIALWPRDFENCPIFLGVDHELKFTTRDENGIVANWPSRFR